MSLIPRRAAPHTGTPPATSALSQNALRHRRRHWLRVHYTAEFDLAAEIAAITEPLAAEISYLPRPTALRGEIDAIADAVHEVLSAVVGMLAESRHLDTEARSRTLDAVRDLAQRPREPQITDAQISDGSWASVLTAHAAPYTGDFATFLGRALPPGHPQLNGRSASERLEAVLRVLDDAALTASRRIPRVAARQALPTLAEANAAARARREAERAQTALARLAQGASR